jgi:hypothetical protein
MAAVGKNYFIARMDLLDRASLYEFRFDGVSIGALSLGRAWYNASIDVTMANLRICYYVNFPAAGSMHASHRRNILEVTPGCGALYQPSSPVHMTPPGTRWRDELDRPSRSWAPRPVRRAVEALHDRSAKSVKHLVEPTSAGRKRPEMTS